MLSHSGSRAVAAPTNDAQLFAQVRTFRIIQFSGLTCSTGSIDLTARASDILCCRAQIFIRFRELKPRYSYRAPVVRPLPRRHESLQLFCPVLNDDDVGTSDR